MTPEEIVIVGSETCPVCKRTIQAQVSYAVKNHHADRSKHVYTVSCPHCGYFTLEHRQGAHEALPGD